MPKESIKVYLAGPIFGCADKEIHGWRHEVTENMSVYYKILDPTHRDYRGKEENFTNEIVQLDKQDIRNSDVVVAYCFRPAWGTAMEIQYAHKHDIPVVSIVSISCVSPWLRYHSTLLVESPIAASVWIFKAFPK